MDFGPDGPGNRSDQSNYSRNRSDGTKNNCHRFLLLNKTIPRSAWISQNHRSDDPDFWVSPGWVTLFRESLGCINPMSVSLSVFSLVFIRRTSASKPYLPIALWGGRVSLTVPGSAAAGIESSVSDSLGWVNYSENHSDRSVWESLG